MKASIFAIPLLAAGLLLSSTSHANETRTWTDSQGRTVEATFLRLEDNTVVLRTRDGRRHKFDLSRLSEADQALARTLPAVQDAPPADRNHLQSAAWVDGILQDAWAAGGITPNPRATDEQFVRRIYLDITGTIPTYQQTVAFLRDSSPDKRRKLIDQLLDSPGYRSHLYNYFADMLRLRDRLSDGIVATARATNYIDWIKKNIAEDRPYNEMVHDMLTATGKVWNNGAAGYLLRDSGMALDNLANTISIFLGTDIACAQCHDHPFDDWTQKEFYQMAAFFGATNTQLGRNDFKNGDPAQRIRNEVIAMLREQGHPDPDPRTNDQLRRQFNSLNDLINANRFAIHDLDQNRMRLPHDYAYDDASPNDPVAPRLMVFPEVDMREHPSYQLSLEDFDNPRLAFAKWTTVPENPRFALTIANRMWKRAFGLGVIEPVHDIKTPDDAVIPELASFLGDEMIRVNFSLKEFMRMVYNTDAYQRAATNITHDPEKPYFFPGPVLRRMTAEQTWDSFMTLVLGDADRYTTSNPELYSRIMDVDLDSTDLNSILGKLSAFQQMEERARQARRQGGDLAMAGSEMMMDESRSIFFDDEPAPTANGDVVVSRGMQLMRASELPQPAPPGHFLRQFGQSDRLLTDNSFQTGSIPQVMMLLNGEATDLVTDSKGLIFRHMDQQRTSDDRVEVVFQSILNRRPTSSERSIARRELQSNGDAGYANIIWALINTREFLFIQ